MKKNISIISLLALFTIITFSCTSKEPKEKPNNNTQVTTSNENGLIVVNGYLIRCLDEYIPDNGIVELPNTIKVIGRNAFGNSRKLKSIKIPNSVNHIDEAPFANCSNLNEVIMGDNVESIGRGTFARCTQLRKVKLSSNLKSIGDWTFQRCESLKEITIPKSVTSIGEGTFDNCKNLTTIHCKGITPPKVKEYEGKHSWLYKATLFVPKGSKKLYEDKWQRFSFKNIIEE